MDVPMITLVYSVGLKNGKLRKWDIIDGECSYLYVVCT